MSSGELRRTFHDDLAGVRSRVDDMAATVIAGIGAVTDALLEGDRQGAEAIVAADAAIDRSYPVVESDVFQLVATQAPMARDLRFLIATLRVAMEVERSGDLVASVGRRVGSIEASALTTTVRSLLRGLGDGAASMFSSAAGAYAALAADEAARIPARDDAMDDLHRDLLRELFESRGPVASVVELGLIARFYERIADHAVVIAERVRFVVDGSMNPGDADEQDWF